MRLAGFPATSPWFRDSLLSEIPLDELHKVEPAGAVVRGIASKNRRDYTATIDHGGRTASASGRTAATALLVALVTFERDAA